jgi:hypothetical protein
MTPRWRDGPGTIRPVICPRPDAPAGRPRVLAIETPIATSIANSAGRNATIAAASAGNIAANVTATCPGAAGERTRAAARADTSGGAIGARSAPEPARSARRSAGAAPRHLNPPFTLSAAFPPQLSPHPPARVRSSPSRRGPSGYGPRASWGRRRALAVARGGSTGSGWNISVPGKAAAGD